MYILMITRGYPSQKDSQWGCFEKDQAKALIKRGHKVVVMSVDRRYKTPYRRDVGISYKKEDGIDIYNIFLFPLPLQFKMITQIIANKLCDILFRKIVKEQGKPDILYSHYLFNSILGVHLKKKSGIPVVAIEHWSSIAQDSIMNHVLWLGNNTYKNVDEIIAVSISLKNYIYQHFNQNSLVVHNMIGDEFELTDICKKREDKLVFVSTGSLIYRKGFDILISAFEKLNLDSDLWKLIIIGSGEKYDDLLLQINENNLQNNIYLLGQKNKSEIVDVLVDSNVFVLPSRNENFSVAVLEALACGLPVIASICGGIRECIDDHNGLLFPVDDVDELASKIKYFIENRNKYDNNLIAENCYKKYSPNVVATQLTDIFRKVVDKSNSKKQ